MSRRGSFKRQYKEEISLQQQWNNCRKKRRHNEYICWSEFQSDPTSFIKNLHMQDENIIQFILATGALTVRLKVSYVSKDRGEKDSLFEHRGGPCLRTGTGLVIFRTESTNDRCPHCDTSKEPHWRIYVVTATHVVFDHKEAASATIDLDYDFLRRDEPGGMVKKFYGVRLSERSIFGDCCVLECVTCKPGIKDTLDSRLSERSRLEKILPKTESKQTIIIAHPHGLQKRVSFGSIHRNFKEKKDVLNWTLYKYDAATCEGSSGSPVIILSDLWWQRGSKYLLGNLPTHVRAGDKISRCDSIHSTLDPNSRRRSLYNPATPPVNKLRRIRSQALHNMDIDNTKLIHAVNELVCKVTVRYTALSRPKFVPKTTIPYTNPGKEGRKTVRNGTGVVCVASDLLINRSCRCCCSSCRISENPKTGIAVVYVKTAKHIVFNTAEAKHAKFNFENMSVELEGVSVVASDMALAYSIVECITHDLESVSLFQGYLKELQQADKLIRRRKTKQTSTLAAVISYPHGSQKVIRVGQCFKKAVTSTTEDKLQTTYTHTTQTSRGSSGGPVVVIDKTEPKVTECFLIPHVHSASLSDGSGCSSYGASGFIHSALVDF